jgi:hypothetical protein
LPLPGRLEALERWTRANLQNAEEILPWLLRSGAAPEEALASGEWADRLALIPDWLEPHLEAWGTLVLGPENCPGPADLGRWFNAHPLDLEIRGPLPQMALPRVLRIRQRLSLDGVSCPRTLRVLEFLSPQAELTLDRCPDLRTVMGCTGLRRLIIMNCPALDHLALESTVLEHIEIQDCPSLRILDLPISRVSWNPPDLILRTCTNLESVGPRLKRDFMVRDLTILNCPNLRPLPVKLKVRRRKRLEGCGLLAQVWQPCGCGTLPFTSRAAQPTAAAGKRWAEPPSRRGPGVTYLPGAARRPNPESRQARGA